MYKSIGCGGQCLTPHPSRREAAHGQVTKATCEGPHTFGLQVSKLQEPGVGWVGKKERKWEVLDLQVGGRLSRVPHPKAGVLDQKCR